MKICIIGGGASGMVAALTAAKLPNCRVFLLERQNRVGRKLLATGNGRCNLTNRYAAPDRYHTDAPNALQKVLGGFSPEQALEFFHALGLYTVEAENGKFYPRSDQANSVVDTLRFALEQAGVTVITSCDVLSLSKKARGYSIQTTQDAYYADKVIISTGGCAGKTLGGTHSGYRLLESLGHTCTELFPALVQIRTELTHIRSLKGVRATAGVTLKIRGIPEARSRGEVQFTDFGISGPAIFEISRAASVSDGDALLLLDLMPEYTEDALQSAIADRCGHFPLLTAEQLLTGMLNTRLGQVLVKFAEIPLHTALSELTPAHGARIAHCIKHFPLPVLGVLGMEHAQVTAGGIPLSEVHADTLESRKAPGIFITGEVLNVDGDCGGFNLQWAWATGYRAGHLGMQEARL